MSKYHNVLLNRVCWFTLRRSSFLHIACLSVRGPSHERTDFGITNTCFILQFLWIVLEQDNRSYFKYMSNHNNENTDSQPEYNIFSIGLVSQWIIFSMWKLARRPFLSLQQFVRSTNSSRARKCAPLDCATLLRLACDVSENQW